MERNDTGNTSHGAASSKRAAPAWLTADWFNRAHKALMADFGDDPELKRQMVQFLFDAGFYDASRLSFRAGLQRFTDCLHPAKPEKFRITEIWALSIQFRRFATISAMAEDLGGRPAQIVEMVTQVLAAQQEMLEKLSRIMASTGYAPLADARMHPHLREAIPTLSLGGEGGELCEEGEGE